MGIAEDLFLANRSTIVGLRKHPMSGRFKDPDGIVDLQVYFSQGRAAFIEAAPLFASITLRAPSSEFSEEAYSKFRQFFLDVQALLGRWITADPVQVDVLPATHELGSFIAGLAAMPPYCGGAALAAMLEVLSCPDDSVAQDPNASELQRDLVRTTHGSTAKAMLAITRDVVDLTPADDLQQVARVYREALKHFEAFWYQCWALAAPGL